MMKLLVKALPMKRDRSRSRIRKTHNVLVYPKVTQTSEVTKKTIQSKVTSSQINVKVNSLKHDIVRYNYDVVSINDPYLFDSKITEFPCEVRKYFHVSGAIAGVLIANPIFRVFPIRIDRNLALELDIGNEKITVVSIYCIPSANITTDLNDLKRLLLEIGDKNVLIFGDFNAKSSIWGPRGTDTRGQHVLELINNFDIQVVNNSDSLPTFNGPQGMSWIDLMMIRHFDIGRIQNWKIDDRITMSDYQIMDFTVTGNNIREI
ncbi:hypothetical protein AVEN_127931-1 [Araneus ventricosus]|uniref:Endonuclease/exonuclease/phosphatase domain-containing protein n=1 Tax=Araneus ventricosus TaxID=182803 RepID=A0A4Y1ZYY2_ARAVE|nr:hypothetical protein AVEN_127931-1 [Araneus ventricosus]